MTNGRGIALVRPGAYSVVLQSRVVLSGTQFVPLAPQVSGCVEDPAALFTDAVLLLAGVPPIGAHLCEVSS